MLESSAVECCVAALDGDGDAALEISTHLRGYTTQHLTAILSQLIQCLHCTAREEAVRLHHKRLELGVQLLARALVLASLFGLPAFALLLQPRAGF